MSFVAAEVIPYALPFKEPYVTARGRLTRREMVLLRIRDDDGVQGLGEAVPLSLRGGVGIETVVRELEGLEGTQDATEGLSLPARCAVSTALLDLEEKRRGTKGEHALGGLRHLIAAHGRDQAVTYGGPVGRQVLLDA